MNTKRLEKLKLTQMIDPSPRLSETRIPSTVDPVEVIEAEGNAYSRLKSGEVSGWIIVTAWLFLAFPMFLVVAGGSYIFGEMLAPTNTINDTPWLFNLLGFIVFGFFFYVLPGMLIYIVVKGTWNKLNLWQKQVIARREQPKRT